MAYVWKACWWSFFCYLFTVLISISWCEPGQELLVTVLMKWKKLFAYSKIQATATCLGHMMKVEWVLYAIDRYCLVTALSSSVDPFLTLIMESYGCYNFCTQNSCFYQHGTEHEGRFIIWKDLNDGVSLLISEWLCIIQLINSFHHCSAFECNHTIKMWFSW